ncbi:Acyl-CoA-binding protein [Aphelenchoides avenae]|nr:Acyl-CoA-binding protein [Aphelenchus avenae]
MTTENGVQAPAADEPKENGIQVTVDNAEFVFGFPLDALYKHAVKYYKENEKNGELQVDYPQRLRFMAYSKQAKYGTFKEEAADCGWFDLVGNDSAKEWKKLGDVSAEQAMLEFVRLLDAVCPAFKPHIKEKAALEGPKRRSAGVNVADLLNGSGEPKEVLEKYQLQKKQIQEALNKQTYHQFLAYAQQTYAGDPEKH